MSDLDGTIDVILWAIRVCLRTAFGACALLVY